MEATREIYWNVGHGVVIPMYILAFASFGVMAWGFWKRLPVWRQGKALNRFDHYYERAKLFIVEVISQKKIGSDLLHPIVTESSCPLAATFMLGRSDLSSFFIPGTTTSLASIDPLMLTVFS